MPNSLTWLHLSDLHARLKSDWDAREITESLVADLKHLNKEHGLRPDLVFVTGDLAFGATPQEKLVDQYVLVKNFLDAVRGAFQPAISIRNLYLVPGNHDIDRNEVTPGEMDWLRSPARGLNEIVQGMQSNSKQWRSWMERFIYYRAFLRSYGLNHLAPDSQHLTWADAQEIGGRRIGICGFNSAWSAYDNEDKGKLWAALNFQIAKNIQEMGPVNIAIAAIHHPGNWLTSVEDPAGMRHLRQKFQIVLHGHEHQEWVDFNDNRHLLISAGACYESSWMDNGYNWGHIDFDKITGAVWLREWDRIGRGWIPKNIFGKTSNGVFPLNDLDWLGVKQNQNGGASTGAPLAESPQAARASLTEFEHYTKLYCTAIVATHDYLELFGCDIPRELQQHQLSVAYVSLNLTTKSDDDEDQLDVKKSPSVEQPVDAISAAAVKSSTEISEGSSTLDVLLDRLPTTTSRLLILGPAGGGKSTLLRWCAINAAREVLDALKRSTDETIRDCGAQSAEPPLERPTRTAQNSVWMKIPLLLKLRDFSDGRLPAATELPKRLAKHLQAAPTDWITNLLAAGDALILLDGVDELHKDARSTIAIEIDELVRTYPNCTYIITSRPGAVADDWLARLDFKVAVVEPMGRSDREEFISKWYKSAAKELIRRPRIGEDLANTAARLKAELRKVCKCPSPMCLAAA